MKSRSTKRQTSSSRRTLLKSNRGKRFVKRSGGRFKESVSVGRSLSTDRRRKSRTKVSKGYGDRGET